MRITEEHVTRAMARQLVFEGWEIVAVHPPDGQGPFVIPKPPRLRAIERSSYHPDIVALRKTYAETELMLAECKLFQRDLKDDLEKLEAIASSRASLLFALYRCQFFEGGATISIDFETISRLSTNDLPIRFAVAAMSDSSSKRGLGDVGGFQCEEYLFGRIHLS